MGHPARQFWPTAVPTPRARDLDGREIFDGRTDRPTVDPSVSPSNRPSRRPSTRALSATEARLVSWLETYCRTDIPKEQRPSMVRANEYAGHFVGARAFVLKHGLTTIFGALHDLTVMLDPYADGRWRRYWRPEIVSPASFLNHYVNELTKTEAP